MTREWVPMRVAIDSDPQTIAMADYLASQPRFLAWLGLPVLPHDHHNVTVGVTVAALVRCWGAACDVGRGDGEDLILRHGTLLALSRMAGVPCFGEALRHVGWAVEEVDAKDKSLIRLPKFKQLNTPAEDRHRRANRERQRRFRAKGKGEQGPACGGHSAARNVTVTQKSKDTGQNSTGQINPSPTPPLEGNRVEGGAQIQEQEQPTVIPAARAAPRYLPSDRPDLAPAAKELVAYYQRTVRPKWPPGSAQPAVIRLLAEGLATAEQLRRAIDGYAAHCDRNDIEPKARQQASTFFGDAGQHSGFLDFHGPGKSSAPPASPVLPDKKPTQKGMEMLRTRGRSAGQDAAREGGE